MSEEMLPHLMALKETTARIDERTLNIHKNQKALRQALCDHEARDYTDFGKLHERMDKSDSKVNKIMGAVALASFVVVVGIGIIAS